MNYTTFDLDLPVTCLLCYTWFIPPPPPPLLLICNFGPPPPPFPLDFHLMHVYSWSRTSKREADQWTVLCETAAFRPCTGQWGFANLFGATLSTSCPDISYVSLPCDHFNITTLYKPIYSLHLLDNCLSRLFTTFKVLFRKPKTCVTCIPISLIEPPPPPPTRSKPRP